MLAYRIRLSLFFSLSLCSFFLLPVAASRQALARSSPITITSHTDTINFPNSIDFNISASDSVSTISRANIYMMFGLEGNQQQAFGTLTVSQPAHFVMLHFTEDTRGSRFHPPGTPVSYYWQLWDNDGYTLIDVTQQFTTVDTRFNWQHLTQGMLQVNWYNRSQDFGQIMLNQASANIKRISDELGRGLLHPINLWIYETTDDFHGSLAPGSYEWVGGIALPSLYEASIAIASSSDTTLIRDMPHELTHLIFHQLIEHGIYAPTWFDEGLAVYNQIYQEREMTQRFVQARDTHTLLRLNTLDFGFPADANKAYLAYAQSWQLLDFMYHTFGRSKMALLIRQMDNSQTDFDEDLQKALGEDQLHLENQWYVYLHQPPLLSPEQFTPTPQPTARPQHTQSATLYDGSSGLIIGIGVVLILGSLVSLVVIFVVVRRQHDKSMTENLLYKDV